MKVIIILTALAAFVISSSEACGQESCNQACKGYKVSWDGGECLQEQDACICWKNGPNYTPVYASLKSLLPNEPLCNDYQCMDDCKAVGWMGAGCTADNECMCWKHQFNSRNGGIRAPLRGIKAQQ